MTFDKAIEFARELSLRKYRGKIITSTYDPVAKKWDSSRDQKKNPEKAKSSPDLTKTRQKYPGGSERSKSSLDVVKSQQKLAADLENTKTGSDAITAMALKDGTIVGAVQDEKPHTRIVYDTKSMRLAQFKLKTIAPMERLLEKLKLFLFRRTKNVKVNTDKYWYKHTGEFKDTYERAVASKTFIVKGRPRNPKFPNPVPKEVLFSLRYPSPYPYTYNRVVYKFNKKQDKDKDKKEESEKSSDDEE